MHKKESLTAWMLSCVLAAGLGALPLAGCTLNIGTEAGSDASPAKEQEAAPVDEDAEAAEDEQKGDDAAQEDTDEKASKPAADQGVWMPTKVTMTYTADGDSSQTIVTNEYDEHGSLIKVTESDGTEVGYADTYETDEDGFATSVSSAYGDQTVKVAYTIEKDDAGRPVKTTGDNGSVETRAYDVDGNLQEVSFEFTYPTENESGTMVERAYQTVTRYDADGKPVEQRTGRPDNTQVTTYDYEMGKDERPVSVTCTTTSYDEGGNPIEESTYTETRTMTYDGNGCLASVTTKGTGYTYEQVFEYVLVKDPSLFAQLDAHLLGI